MLLPVRFDQLPGTETFDFFPVGPGPAVEIRVAAFHGEPFFYGQDVGRVLGFNTKGTGNYHTILDPSEKLVIKKRVVKTDSPLRDLFQGSAHSIVFISESGLYKLIMRSDKPQARRFQDWATKTVLPAIRKDGAYIMGEGRTSNVQESGCN